MGGYRPLLVYTRSQRGDPTAGEGEQGSGGELAARYVVPTLKDSDPDVQQFALIRSIANPDTENAIMSLSAIGWDGATAAVGSG